MTRTILDAQLHAIRTGTNRLGTLVTTALDLALQAIQSKDQAFCHRVVKADHAINDLRLEMERLALRLLTLQQPLVGRDLRFLSSIPGIVTNLERIGDNATGIAEILLLMAGLPTPSIEPEPRSDLDQTLPLDRSITEDSIVHELLALGGEAHRVLQGTMLAFEHNDAHAARAIWQEDDVIDVRYHMVRHHLMTMLTSLHAIPALRRDAHVLQRMTYWLWVAHKLERVGDHSTNMCERIVFFIEGGSGHYRR